MEDCRPRGQKTLKCRVQVENPQSDARRQRTGDRNTKT
jgi:hypothetical protein